MKRSIIESKILKTYQPMIDEVKYNIDLTDYDIKLHRPSVKMPAFALRFALRSFLVIILAGLGYFMFQTAPSSTNSVLAKSTDIVAFEAVSSTDLLVQTAIHQATNLASVYPQTTSSLLAFEPLSAVATELDTLNYYLNMIEQFLSTQTALDVVLQESELSQYDYKIVYQSVDLSGKPIIYNLYYNESDLGSSPTSDFVFNDEGSDHTALLLTGEITILKTKYLLEGKKIIDGNDEIYSLYSYIDTANYVYVRYETDLEDGNKKFFYTVVTDGQTINKSKIKVETENNNLVTDLEFVEGDAVGKYRFVRGELGTSAYIDVTYQILGENEENEQGSIRVDIITDEVSGNTTYAYTVRPDGEDVEHKYETERKDSFGEQDDDEQEDEQPEDHEQEPEDIEDQEDSQH